jgi:integrase
MAKEKVVRRTLVDGTVKEYRYDTGKAQIYTVGDLITDYRKSPEFKRLAPGSRVNYERALGRIREYEKVAVTEIRRRHILGQRDALADTPGEANGLTRMWGILMIHALDRDHIIASPAYRLKKLPIGEHKRWPDAMVEYALTTFKDRTEWARRAVILALYTGQRASDLVKMRWSDYDGSGIRVVQQKTGEPLWIAAHTELRGELAAWKADAKALTVLHQKKGNKPWTAQLFAVMFSDLIAAHPALKGLVFHGLRKVAASRLADAGCSAHEIQAITGHRNLAMLEHYTREANQKQNATAAILKLERKTPPARG